MYLKKQKIFSVVVIALFIFVSCETSTNYQISNDTNNKIIKVNNKEKTTNNITSETTEENKRIDQNITLNVGLMLPLSGKHYQIGQSLLNAAQLAIARTNNKKIVFNVIDTADDDNMLSELYELIFL